MADNVIPLTGNNIDTKGKLGQCDSLFNEMFEEFINEDIDTSLVRTYDLRINDPNFDFIIGAKFIKKADTGFDAVKERISIFSTLNFSYGLLTNIENVDNVCIIFTVVDELMICAENYFPDCHPKIVIRDKESGGISFALQIQLNTEWVLNCDLRLPFKHPQ